MSMSMFPHLGCSVPGVWCPLTSGGGGARREGRWPDGWDECRDSVTCPWRVSTLGAAVEAVIPRKGGTRSTVWQVCRCVKLLVFERHRWSPS